MTRNQRVMTTILLMALTLTAIPIVSAENYIVKDGQPNAEIVIPETPTRSVKLAAKDLQTYIKKISGADLPIKPTFAMTGEKGKRLTEQYPPDEKEMPVKIYVGDSWRTDRLGVTDDGLEWGAFRMKSGKNWLALVGRDNDFTPMGIWSRGHSQWKNQGIKEWDEAVGGNSKWNSPVGQSMDRAYNSELDLWKYDEKGSFNAVSEFLRRLGVRWYMPGELGEIVPKMSTIPLPDVDETVTPDYKLRMTNFDRYGRSVPVDDIMWALRLGVNHPYGYNIHHGMRYITERDEQKKLHPEFYAIYNGERDTDSRTANPCLSSEELFQENLRFIRFMLDMYDLPRMGVSAPDGFSSICECEKCKGKDTPERGNSGRLSDYMWNYVNRIAKEVAKTHPDKEIVCGAYSTYRMPPEKIDKLEPNVRVRITNGRPTRPLPPEELEDLRRIRKAWAAKTSNKQIVCSLNYPFTQRGEFRPCYIPHFTAQQLKELKGLSYGEDIWVPEKRGLHFPGLNHLNTYVATRFWWDADQDVDKLLDEYYEKFYGPAAPEMKAFIEFSEDNWTKMGPFDSVDIVKKALDLFDAAKAKVDPDSVYGKRIAMIDEFLPKLRKRYELIAKGRVGIMENQAENVDGKTGGLKIDGNLDEEIWGELPNKLERTSVRNAKGKVVAIEKIDETKNPTFFKIMMDKENLYFGVKCYDENLEKLSVAGDAPDDAGLWNGDTIELLLETDHRAYYQFAINPKGVLVDLDRGSGKGRWFQWTSEAEVATQINKKEGYWTAEVKIPFTQSTEDPLHLVIGNAPTAEKPWYFNVGRQQLRDDERRFWMFTDAPKSFHDVLRFAKLTKK